VVLVDEPDLALLNLSDETLPVATKKVVANLLSTHLAALNEGQQFMDQDVRLGLDGVFVGNRKVAELAQVVQHIARTDVVEIQGPIRTRSVGAGLGLGVLGLFLGYGAAWDAGNRSTAWAMVVGFPLAGGFLGSRIFGHTRQGVISAIVQT
jgi:hypothetical protein